MLPNARQFVEAEIVATQDEFIAVFETQPGVDDAPLGIVCGPVRILPKSVLKVVAMRTTTAAGIIAGKEEETIQGPDEAGLFRRGSV